VAIEIVNSWPEIITALGSAGFGGLILKTTEGWLGRARLRAEQDRQLREELRAEILDLRKEVDTLRTKIKEREDQLYALRDKYWSVSLKFRMFQMEISGILIQNQIDPNIILSKHSLSDPTQEFPE
jgi:chromosome segregation ATPase